MTMRLVFLTVVCVGSLAFGEPYEQPDRANGPLPPTMTGQDYTLTPGPDGTIVMKAKPAPKTTARPVLLPSTMTGHLDPLTTVPPPGDYTLTPRPDGTIIMVAKPAPKTPAPKTPAPKTPAPTGQPLPYTVPPGTPVPVPPTPITPAPMLSGLVPTASEPMGFTMHFHMGGNFDASFEMNVTQGQAKKKASPAKKRKSDVATSVGPYAQPPSGPDSTPSGTYPQPPSGGPYGNYSTTPNPYSTPSGGTYPNTAPSGGRTYPNPTPSSGD